MCRPPPARSISLDIIGFIAGNCFAGLTQEGEVASERREGFGTAEEVPDREQVAPLRAFLISFGFSPEIVLPKWPSPSPARWRVADARAARIRAAAAASVS
jgi:hypothetical protein